MMRLVLKLLLPSLLLACCEKPSSSGNPSQDSVSSRQPAKDGSGRNLSSSIREKPETPDTPETLREKLEATAAIESSEERFRTIASAAWNALEIDPKLASEAFLQLPENNPERIRLIQHYAMRLAEQNHQEAVEWANSLESDLESSTALSQIALAIAESDPRRAANILSESGMEGREFDVAITQVVQRWAAQSPPDAAGWVSLFPQGAARETGIRMIVEQWLPRDTPTAFAWLEGIKDPQLRKETARAMEGVILQQKQEVRDEWLKHAKPGIQAELDQQRDQAIKDVGDNIPPPLK